MFLKSLLFILLLGMILWVAFALLRNWLCQNNSEKKLPEKPKDSASQKTVQSQRNVAGTTPLTPSSEPEKSSATSAPTDTHIERVKEEDIPQKNDTSSDEISKENTATTEAKIADDLKKIKGIGPVNEKRLNALGITQFSQIAAWNQEDINRVDEELSFKGRIQREKWIEQAKQLLE